MFTVSEFKQKSILQFTSPLKDCPPSSRAETSPSKKRAKQRTLFESFGSSKTEDCHLKNNSQSQNGKTVSNPEMAESVGRKRTNSCSNGNGGCDDQDLDDFFNDSDGDFSDMDEPAGKKVKL